jgi:predicted flap endonuclease-1-like 5' DNA nuclease
MGRRAGRAGNDAQNSKAVRKACEKRAQRRDADMQEQIQNTDSNPAPPAPEFGDDAQTTLQAELDKWRGRVPKLAAALRQRTEQVEALKVELEDLKRGSASGPGRSDAGVRARDELIAELEAKLDALNGRYKTAQGDLHARNLEVADLKEDLRLWKDKWQSVTQSLDAQAEAAESRQDQVETLNRSLTDVRQELAERDTALRRSEQALGDALAERESLLSRNEKLFETTEMANRQIETLADSLAEMRQELRDSGDREAAARARNQALQRDHEDQAEALRREQETLRQDCEQLQSEKLALVALTHRLTDELQEVDEFRQTVMAAAAGEVRNAQLHDERVAESAAVAAAAIGRAEQAEAQLAELKSVVDEQRCEIARLESCIVGADEANGQREDERRQLSEQLAVLETRNHRLEGQLAERSALVVELEESRSRHDQQLHQLEQEKQELDDARHRAERQVKENAQHITQLVDRLERQKELMENLEKELAEAHEAHASAQVSRSAEPQEKAVDTARLEEKIRRLEQLVREQAEELNRERWERQVMAKEDVDETGGKMLLVLNQQLNDAREQNASLLDRVRDLEDELTHIGMQRDGDDLTRIHGIGPKLAEQLNDVGIYRLEQIAELDELTLSDEAHALYAHKGRILRDGWIDQAARLVSH